MTSNGNRRKDKIPNFFIVGAPKCGTTALYQYLKEHPNIFMAPKERHFFATDNFAGRESLDDYLNLFKRASDKHYAIGEASVFYLYSPVAIKNIYEFNNKAKIIAMLRNPIDLVYAMHATHVWTYDEDEKDFKKAWYLQEERRKGYKIPSHSVYPPSLQYAQVGKLGEQVERLLNIFPPEQVKLLLFDDFKSSTKSVYEDVMSFLKVPSDGRTDFPRINENQADRIYGLCLLLRRLPCVLVKAVRLIEDKFNLREQVEWLQNSLIKLNSKKVVREPLDPEFKREMLKEFNDDIDKLSRILNRDLSHWKNQ